MFQHFGKVLLSLVEIKTWLSYLQLLIRGGTSELHL